MNVLLITSDEHNKFVMGCGGDPVVRTPNLDRLAEQGTRFTSAYTNNPICMPARATLATGRYGHAVRSFDNGSAYDGMTPSWGHRLHEQGHQVPTFGKLHFDPDADTGFDARLPLQAKKAYSGALLSWARGAAPATRMLRRNVEEARVGEFEYTTYDRYTADSAGRWLATEADPTRSWAAHVSFAYPHYPFRVPVEYLAGLDPDEIPLPPQWQPDDWPDHLELEHRRVAQSFTEPLPESVLRTARWIYYGMVAFLDEQVGRVLDALEACGLADDTLVIYTTDHGDMLGEKGLFMKGVMYEGSAGVPMILRGPGVPTGAVSRTPVSLADIFPTVVDGVGAELTEADVDLPGRSLLELAAAADDLDRVVFSEYHGPSSIGANYMVRKGSWKYVEYCAEGADPQLFDLDTDPRELTDLGRSSDHADVRADMAAELRVIVEPRAVDQEVRGLQSQWLAEAGGLESLKGAAPAPGSPLGGYTVPPPEIMDIVGWPAQ
ncbi:MAG: sulfatase-like hydrolase/transferase [Actinomycetia bacterium]|nr:sulfatase-like hydrolase/transferase [Actinomycetes bacterium]